MDAVRRVVGELLWFLRREGLNIAPPQAIAALQALGRIGLVDRTQVKAALRATLVTVRRDEAVFERAFDAFFAQAPERRTLHQRLLAEGVDEGAVDALKALVRALGEGDARFVPLGLLLGTGPDWDRALARQQATALAGASSRSQLGFLAHRLRTRLGLSDARSVLDAVEARLRDALGDELAALVRRCLADEMDEAEARVRSFVEQAWTRQQERQEQVRGEVDSRKVPFAALSDEQSADVRRALRNLAARLRGGERVRRRRGRRGRVDMARTLRAALGTQGVPMAVHRKRRRRDKPELFVLCDVSDSVRSASAFLLEFVAAAQELFERTRSWVFVSELGETTTLFRDHGREALARAFSGEVVPVSSNSNYGRALRAFRTAHEREVTRRVTVVILGDGRTNFLDAGADVVRDLRARARSVVWICPEDESRWGVGDSAMPLFAAAATRALVARTAEELERAAAAVATLRG